MKKILVTGAGGFVGARILEMWRDRFELSAFPPDFLRTADETAVRRFITAERPDVIVHTAALSNTQVCQQHPEESFRANVLLPEWVAAAAAETGAKLLSFSSDQVYAGVQQPGPLAEALPLSPANVYGRHKLEAEARVMARCPDAVALRLPWMYDLPGGRRRPAKCCTFPAATTGAWAMCGRSSQTFSPRWRCPAASTTSAVGTTRIWSILRCILHTCSKWMCASKKRTLSETS